MCRVFTKLPFISINPLSIELYQTHYRSVAMGFLEGFGRIGSVIMPAIAIKLDASSAFYPFALFSALMVGCSVSAFLCPEPMDRQLDTMEEEEPKDIDNTHTDTKPLVYD
mmetsp:Transcript_9975/g.8500  ORF Transcript_9975/g.8500 Transcript_9975/m.8500 type:complete len:110 (+) Transcript_9975:1119-1448(+)